MKTIKFMQDGNDVRIISFNEDTISDNLKPAIYTLCFCKFTGYYLRNHSPRFSVPKTIYGTIGRRVDKVINTYNERKSSTGILLSGDKGAGKTMTSALVANRMIDMGLPIILIEEPHSGAGFNEILSNIGECCVFFDEFGKMYKRNTSSEEESQTDLLSLFDGTGSQKRLIMLTENNTYDINEFMMDRPGRVYYHFRHNKLDQELIAEYCIAKGLPRGTISEVLMRCDTSFSFSFDTLQAIVEEWLRYGGSIKDIASDLNIEQPITRNQQMKIKSVVDARTQEKYTVPEKCNIVDFPASECAHVSWVISTDDEGKEVHNSTIINVKEIVARTDTKVVFECMEQNVLITAEILPMRMSAYDKRAF